MGKGERISQFVESLEAGGDPNIAPGDIVRNKFYRAFFRCWNQQQYYEAHDVLEHLWLRTRSEDAQYFKGLIQSAGAFVHLKKQFEHPTHPKHGRRLAPAVRLFHLAEENLAPFEPLRHGLDVAKLRRLLMDYARAILDSGHKNNPWSPEKAPALKLKL
jgi:hypothetical protein